MTQATVAIVDDDPSFSDYLRTFLRSRGYESALYTSGQSLLAAIRDRGVPDVVLLDVMMPGFDGIETLRALRLAHPSAQVVMLSGGRTPATIIEAVRLGAVDYVLKPGDPEGIGEIALEGAIRNALERAALTSEVSSLRAQVTQDPDGLQPCWNWSRTMQPVLAMVDRIADSDVSVLLRGESGVGKEVIAREIHRRSPRRSRPFVKVNCGALPGDLLESEMFGHERGAFTGAASTRVGKFEFASDGTLMLDEIGEMPLALQVKILHALQDHSFTRLGANRIIEVDVRVIAATNRSLEAMMSAGTFREDLYYRLQVIEIHIPPLRERRDEIPQLVEFFLLKYASVYRRKARGLSRGLHEALVGSDWPGNIRELENTMKRLVVLQDESLILAELDRVRRSRAGDSPPTLRMTPASSVAPAAEVVAKGTPPSTAADPAPVPATLPPIGDTSVGLHELARFAAMTAESTVIRGTLDRFRWNRRKTAEHLQVSYKTLLNKMKECGISEASRDESSGAFG